jgi:hypothetical protein
VGVVLVAVLGAYLKFGSKSSQNVINPDDPMHELLITDSIEKAKKDSIAMEEAKKQRERARQDSIDKARRDSVIKSKMEEAAHQKETGNKPQKESKSEAKPEKKEKPEPKAPSDAEIFEQAYKAKDWVTIEKLGNKGYSKAYYPLAFRYYNLGNATGCEKWAKRAIEAGVQTEDAKILLKKIE